MKQFYTWVLPFLILSMLILATIWISIYAVHKRYLWRKYFIKRDPYLLKVIFTNEFFEEKEKYNLGNFDSWKDTRFLVYLNKISNKFLLFSLSINNLLLLLLTFIVPMLMCLNINKLVSIENLICYMLYLICTIFSLSIRFINLSKTKNSEYKIDNKLFIIFDIIMSTFVNRFFMWLALIIFNYLSIFAEQDNANNVAGNPRKQDGSSNKLLFIDKNFKPNTESLLLPEGFDYPNDTFKLLYPFLFRGKNDNEMANDNYYVTKVQVKNNNKKNPFWATVVNLILIILIYIPKELLFVGIKNFYMAFVWILIFLMAISSGKINFQGIIRRPLLYIRNVKFTSCSLITQVYRNYECYKLLLV